MSDQTDLDHAKIERINAQKRVVDVLLCVLLLPVAVPVSLLLALTLRLRQGGEVLFTQERLGYQERPFKVYKFRTMLNTRDEAGNLLPDAQRLTEVGKFMRKTSLDELPQLFNVLKGDMSFVGPRPLFVRYQPFYTSRESIRHLVRPGITGLAQINGRNNLKWDARLELDASYVDRISLRLDSGIILQTLRQVVQSSNVVVSARDSGYPLDIFRTFPHVGRFRMRLLEYSDLSTRVAWMSHPDTKHYMRLSDEITIESTREWFKGRNKKSGRVDFVVENAEDGNAVAMTGLRDRSRDITESYIFVDPNAKGQGIGTISQELLLEWAFGAGRYKYVVSSIHPENAASFRVHSRHGGEIREAENGRSEIWVSEDVFKDSNVKENRHSSDRRV